MASTFEVLAEPTRRSILDLLRERERSVGELVESLTISQPGVSKHLRVLREAGLVSVRTDAQRRVYGLRAEPLSEIDAWLEPYRRYLVGPPRRAGAPPGRDAVARRLNSITEGGVSRGRLGASNVGLAMP